MIQAAPACLLEDIGVLRISGADARKFLQGQLSNDVGQLCGDRLLRAGLHNPQGRTLALLGLTVTSDGDVLALLPGELHSTVGALLKRYVLRSKVQISDAGGQFRLYGLLQSDPALGAAGQLCRYGLGADTRQLLLQPQPAAPLPGPVFAREHWRALDIAAGLPEVNGINSGQFVAQMLNLDCIDAISFNKGCYTGQEIVARAHYRGRVKRRMQRFATAASRLLQPGDAGRLADGRHYRIVQSVLRDGSQEFLAVAHLPGSPHEGEEPAIEPGGDGEALTAAGLPLPYQLPL
jgi:folate-binding protein YgfZ